MDLATKGCVHHDSVMKDAPAFSEIGLAEHCKRFVLARYRDARVRGLAHGAALAEAAGLLWALQPSLPAGIARRATEEVVARDRPA